MFFRDGSAYSGFKRPAFRALALVFCILFFASPIISEAYIFTHLDHEHDHNGAHGSCATCAHIVAAEALLKSVYTALVVAALAFWCISGTFSILKSVKFYAGFYTLVLLKIRLNN